MLLKSYRKEIFRPACNPGFDSVHCIAHLDQDVSEVLPYLNTVLGIAKDATQREVKQAYRRLAMKTHGDRIIKNINSNMPAA